uniref:Uncharacterized protein n=1 Tax=Arundo donax TaxID=35708 RepID=A0A0A9FWE6_ARUDO
MRLHQSMIQSSFVLRLIQLFL